MTTATFPLPSGRAGRATRGFSLARFLAELFEGVAEGRRLADRYETLARKSDSELARLGLKREDIPRAVFASRSH